MVVGGTRQQDDLDLVPRAQDRESLLQNAFHVLPSLKVRADLAHRSIGIHVCTLYIPLQDAHNVCVPGLQIYRHDSYGGNKPRPKSLALYMYNVVTLVH